MTDQRPEAGTIAPRETFNRIADQYDRMRPGYPRAVFDEIARIAALLPDAPETRLLEIGCGTGHATIEFAQRGLAIDCIELGENMAALARARLASFPRVAITVTDFDRFATTSRYRLIYAATAYHWLDPQTRVRHLAALLQAAGWLAVWRNHHVHTAGAGSDFHAAVQQVYAREAPALAAKFCGLLPPHLLPQPEKDEWPASGLFTAMQAHTWLWTRDYTAQQYVQMLNTHSDHQLLPKQTRARLFAQLAQLVEDRGGVITREYATLLHMAQKLP
ncbi:MAG TPA: methyltransferase domain-containing protein [Terracidiphilus sp.]|jgi:SAM-dependent methyltransferase|nr:methyltransferase domain-containing protein [Terracidiphilus sp.]